MRRALRMAAAIALLAPGVARAGAQAIPSAGNSSLPGHVVLVGLAGAVPDTTTGAFTVVVRDGANIPMWDEQVEVRFLVCPGARVAAEQHQPGVTSRCQTNGILASTDYSGIVRVAAVGGGDPAAPHGTGPCATVLAGGLPLGTVRVAYLDLDGSGGLGAHDLAIWLADFGTGESIARADYDGDGAVGAADLSLWLTAYGSGRSVESPTSYCTGFRASP